jgi:hypothetical protein
MANTIILKRSATQGNVPTTAQLELGEIAINTYDGKVFIKKSVAGTPSIVEVGAVKSVNTLTGAVVLDTDDVSEGSTNQYFTNARVRSAVSAGTGISFNSSTGAIATVQNIATSASPEFAGLTLTGTGTVRNILPYANNTYDIGSPTMTFRHVYVGPGSLYVNGKQVITDDSGTITVSTDLDQNLQFKTTGSGALQLVCGASGTITMNGTVQIASGNNITDSAGVKVQFGDAIEMNSNKIIGLGAPSASTDAATKGYVDTQVSAISTSSITQGNSNVTVTDSGSGTVTVSVDGSTALTVTSAGVTVAGNLTVSGTTTTVNSNTVSIADNIVTLNSDADGAPSQNAGIEVERGDEANVQVRWNEGSDVWQFTNDGATYVQIATSTDTLSEGSTNLYHTTARARGAVSASTSTGVAYNSTTGVISLGSIPNSALSNNSITINGSAVALGGTRTLGTDDVAEGATNLYHTTARARGAVSAGTGVSYNSSTGVISADTSVMATKSYVDTAVAGKDNTDEITEGSTNLYFTNARARSAISVSGSLSYNSTTGVVSYTTPSTSGITEGSNLYYTDARARAAVSAGTGISYNSSTGVITNTITQYTDSLARAALSFTAGSGGYNSSTGVITIPTNNNQLTNGAGYVTSSGVTSVATGNGLSGGTITGTGTLTMSGSYTGNFAVTGNITATGEVTAYYSDQRLKTDINPIEGALSKVMAIGGYTYKANELAADLGVSNFDNQIGLLAQEVEAVMPELVTQSALAGYKTIRYDKVVSVLVEAIKEQQAMIEELRLEVKKTLH